VSKPLDFSALGIDAPWVARLRACAYTVPVHVQQEAIPAVLTRSSVLLEAYTGSGKTLAYLVPIVQQLVDERRTQALIVAPTAELAMQIAHVTSRLCTGTAYTMHSCIGGAALARQIDALKKKPHIVIGTPGRVCALIAHGALSCAALRTVVIDEADETLALDDGSELRNMLSALSKTVQLVFCSATLSAQTIAHMQSLRPDAVRIAPHAVMRTAPDALVLPPHIRHTFITVPLRDRIDIVRKLIAAEQPSGVLLFVQDTRHIASVCAKLQFCGIDAISVYADQPRLQRTQAMERLRKNQFLVIVGTDVLARGLDACTVSHVIHYDAPYSPEQYVHRAGRTGRMGNTGTSVILIDPAHAFVVTKLSKKLDLPIVGHTLRFGAFVPAVVHKQPPKKRAPTSSPKHTARKSPESPGDGSAR
jgi:superfamily II DNA/RNA helicase